MLRIPQEWVMLLLRYGSQSPCDVHSMNEG